MITSSAKRLKQAASDRGVKATVEQVEACIAEQGAFQKPKTFRAPKEFNYKMKDTKYLLIVVDIHSSML